MSKKTALSRKPWSAILILIAFILALLCCTGILRSILWKNTNAMGLSLVKNYSSAEEQNINACEAVLDICAEYIAAREQTDISPAELRGDVSPFLTGLTDRYGRDKLLAYGGIRAGGSLLPIPSGSAGRAAAAANRQDWYQASADGETYLSPVYTSGASGQPVVTMCRRIPETGSFLAIDLHPAYFDVSYSDVELPEQSVYFLVDQSGTLVYALSSWQSEREELQALANDCGTNTSCELSNHVLENVKGSDGIVRNVYYHHMANGWTGILTIPKNAILSGSNMFRNISLALIGFGAVLILLQLFQEYRNGQREREHLVYQSAMNSTVRACRAIYYVDVKKKTCDTVYPLREDGKPRHGSYEKEVNDRFRYGVVAEEHRKLVADFLDLSNLVRRLADREHIELQFKRSMFDVHTRETSGSGYEWCSISVTVAEKKDGNLSAIAIAIRSIDDVIRREEEQKQMLSLAVSRAEAANRAKSDFLSRMSHDIRTPMNAILGMTSIAAMHIDEKSRVLDALGKITVSGRHLLGLINGVLDMSRIESGKIRLTEDRFSLADTIDGVLTVFHSQVKTNRLRLNVQLAKLEHENVVGDEQHLQQIFMNIMGNAVKFTPPGGEITIRIQEKPSQIAGSGFYEFTFQDTGIGMEPEYIATIFEPFSRAANSSGSKIEGTGLGMSIAVNIARMMDGDIQVESALGQGSKFTVTVHLKLDEERPADLSALASLPVLVVDDEEYACESACEILRGLGMRAEYALDGDGAVRRISEAAAAGAPFAAVILDWMAPGKDGLETAREIRATGDGRLPIVILSAYDWTDVDAEADEVGVDAFISKPMFRSKLIHVLQSVLGQRGEQEISDVLETFRQQDYSGRRVLLVEDNEINIEVAQELLQIVGIQSDTALNGQLAVDRAEEEAPGYYDLIFMDIQMPVLNGYEATQAIRSSGRPDLRDIPIIAMTADAFSDDIRKSKAAGMNDHVSKPVDLERLEAVLQKWLPRTSPAQVR